MANLTKRGIAYNLKETPYMFISEDETYTYYFSSSLHLEKFIERRKTNRDIVNYSLSKRFGFKIECDLIADIVTYSSIETRGFFIRKKIFSFIDNRGRTEKRHSFKFYEKKEDIVLSFKEI